MGVDPDQLCIESAADAVAPVLKSLGAKVSKAQRQELVRASVYGWLKSRPPAWSTDRLVDHMGSPNAYTLGFAQTILPALASGGHHPFEKPVTDWNKDEMALFLAEAFELMEEQRARTLEKDDNMLY